MAARGTSSMFSRLLRVSQNKHTNLSDTDNDKQFLAEVKSVVIN